MIIAVMNVIKYIFIYVNIHICGSDDNASSSSKIFQSFLLENHSCQASESKLPILYNVTNME